MAAEIDLDALAGVDALTLEYAEPSRFPGIDVDLTFIAAGHRYAEIASAWEDTERDLLAGVSVIDVYDGAVPSVSVRLSFASPERTLTRAEIQPTVDAIGADLAGKGILLKL